jgi:hypothetical protein
MSQLSFNCVHIYFDYVVAGYYSNELSIIDMLHERMLCNIL